jgi:hypothetical protein
MIELIQSNLVNDLRFLQSRGWLSQECDSEQQEAVAAVRQF